MRLRALGLGALGAAALVACSSNPPSRGASSVSNVVVPAPEPEANADDAGLPPAEPVADREAPLGESLRSCNQGADANDRARARSIFQQGLVAYESADYAAAMDAFLKAYALTCAPAVLYNIAMCLEKLDRRGDEADVLEMYLRTGPPSPRAEDVRQMIEKLRAR